MKSFKARRPFLLNLIESIVAACVVAGFIFLFTVLNGSSPETTGDKVLRCVMFAVTVAVTVFGIGYLFDGLRNLLGDPSIVVSDTSISVSGQGTAAIKDVDSLTLRELKKYDALVISVNGRKKPLIITPRYTTVPIITIKKAIENRIEDQK